MSITVKLINGYWMAEIGGRLERYTELPPVARKLYSALLMSEMAVCKANLNIKKTRLNLRK